MNYRLSCATNRNLAKNGFVLEVQGTELENSIFKTQGDNIKENILESVYRGLKVAKVYVQHEDILVIEIQNTHLASWLSGYVEYKGYETYLDKVFEVLESVDCRYKFIFEKKPYMKSLLETRGYDKPKVSKLSDVLEEFK